MMDTHLTGNADGYALGFMIAKSMPSALLLHCQGFNMEASINIVRNQPCILPDMLVYWRDNPEHIGIVTLVTKRHAHVTWLVNTTGLLDTGLNYGVHYNSHYKRGDLTPCPVGTKLTIKQKA